MAPLYFSQMFDYLPSMSRYIGYLILYVVQTLEMLEKKESVLQKKASAEVEKAKQYTKAKNKRGMKVVIFQAFPSLVPLFFIILVSFSSYWFDLFQHQWSLTCNMKLLRGNVF